MAPDLKTPSSSLASSLLCDALSVIQYVANKISAVQSEVIGVEFPREEWLA